jgi:hypothetical protein
MKKGAYLILIASLISFSGSCSFLKKSPDKVLIGTWTFSFHMSPAEAAKKSGEPIPEGISMEMSMAGSATYHDGKKYNEEAEVTLRLRKGGEEKAIRVYLREAGTWEIHDDVLVETTVDFSVTPMDEMTKAILESAPEFKSIITPVKGESTSYKLKEVSDSKFILEEKEYGTTVILQRKS